MNPFLAFTRFSKHLMPPSPTSPWPPPQVAQAPAAPLDYGTGNEGGLRIYYGRIYAPLKLVQQHFANAQFPVNTKAEVSINGT